MNGNLPYARDYSASAGVTKFPAATDQDIQDCIIRQWRAETGEDLLWADDFLGSSFRAEWSESDAAGKLDVTALSAQECSGVARFNSNVDATSEITISNFDLSTRDFRCLARVRIASIGGGTSAAGGAMPSSGSM